jgi:hypothetical protein
MQRDRQHVVALVEAGLRAVPVVDVPVDDCHALGSGGAKALGRERDVVEEAVAVGDRRPGMVPGRPDERVAHLRLTRDGGIDG